MLHAQRRVRRHQRPLRACWRRRSPRWPRRRPSATRSTARWTARPAPIYEQIAQVDPELRFISLSENQRRPLPHLPWLATCHNALDLDDYPYTADKDDYLLFLGRLAPEKGAAAAVRVARRAGMPLKLAGKMHDAAEKEYFEAEVEPMLGGGIE